MKEIYFENISAWRAWLKENRDKEKGVWFVFFNKISGKDSIKYSNALDEALCFGWVDSLIKNIDRERYARKFTPRKDVSKWSEINKKKVENLIRTGKMEEPGLKKVKTAKKNGCWEKPDRPNVPEEIPKDLLSALSFNRKASENFFGLAPSFRKQYIGWIASAKKAETKERRIKESIILLESGKKLGMK